MKTIFITSFHPVISRNILATSVLPVLREAGVRIVVIVPDYKVAYFRETFGGEAVFVEGVPTGPAMRNIWSLFLKHVNRSAINSDTVKLKAEAARHLDGKNFYYYLFFLPIVTLSRFRTFRTLLRVVNRLLMPRGPFGSLFEKYQPNLIFSTDVQIDGDTILMREAKKRGVRIIAKVRSWDNLTQWGIIRIMPDKLIVPTEQVKSEAIHFHDIPEDRIEVLGIPHYDRYLRSPVRSRSDFFADWNLDPVKKLIFYAPVADYRIRGNDIDEYMLKLLAEGDENVWVRFPPNDKVSIGDFTPRMRMVFDKPGVAYDSQRIIDRDIGLAGDDLYHTILSHADLIVSGPSTVAIDAAVVKKPVILINFSPTPRDFWHGIIEYKYNHIACLLQSGGLTVVQSKEEFLFWKRHYLEQYARDEEGQKRLIKDQCYILDGQRGKSLALSILSFI